MAETGCAALRYDEVSMGALAMSGSGNPSMESDPAKEESDRPGLDLEDDPNSPEAIAPDVIAPDLDNARLTPPGEIGPM